MSEFPHNHRLQNAQNHISTETPHKRAHNHRLQNAHNHIFVAKAKRPQSHFCRQNLVVFYRVITGILPGTSDLGQS